MKKKVSLELYITSVLCLLAFIFYLVVGQQGVDQHTKLLVWERGGQTMIKYYDGTKNQHIEIPTDRLDVVSATNLDADGIFINVYTRKGN
tara:strand:+ start:22768 stop:23037 length:270 start_codon:yes stop_codon:yes gene_type:complete